MSTEVVTRRLDTDPEAIFALARSLSHDERMRAQRFRFERDRRRFVAARGHRRELLGARLGRSPASIKLEYGAYGKPRIAEFHFNVAHCRDIALYAFCDEEVGVDVEAIDRLQDADRIAARFFSRHENATYASLDNADKPLGFFNCWTRKEAFVKAQGDGLSMSLLGFDVTLAPGEPARLLRVGDTPGADSGWTLDSFCPAPGYVAAVVSRTR